MLDKEHIKNELLQLFDQWWADEEIRISRGLGRLGPQGGPVYMRQQTPYNLLNELIWKIEFNYANSKEKTYKEKADNTRI